MTVSVSPRSVAAGNQVTITCTAHDANPEPDWRILRAGIVAATQSPWSFIARKSDNGQNYRCVASGDGFSGSATMETENVQLTVTCE